MGEVKDEKSEEEGLEERKGQLNDGKRERGRRTFVESTRRMMLVEREPEVRCRSHSTEARLEVKQVEKRAQTEFGSRARAKKTHVEEERVDALKVPLSVRHYCRRQRLFLLLQLLYTAHIRVMIRPVTLLLPLIVHVLPFGVEKDGWDQESSSTESPGVFLLRMSESRHEEMESSLPHALGSKVGLDVDLADD